jgi:hypothetical protein
MKKLKELCVLIIFLAGVSATNAQFKLGLTAGLNSCIVDYSQLSYNEYTGLNRPFIGITGTYSLNNKVELLGSICYSRIGFNRQVISTIPDSIDYFRDFKQLTSYLECPVFIQLKLNPILRIGFGFQGRWAMGAREIGFENEKSVESGYIERDFNRKSKTFSKFDFGPTARVQLNVNDRLSCELHYAHSLGNYFKSKEALDNAKLRTFGFGMTRFF